MKKTQNATLSATSVSRANPSPDTGLTETQVNERIAASLTNLSPNPPGKTVTKIILSNIFTYFNVIFFIIAIVLTAFGAYRHLTFLGVVISNLVIGIIQELNAKRTLDKMNLLASPKTSVMRDGKLSVISSDSLVRDDIAVFTAGSQICADGEVVAGEASVNESFVTGESDEITKRIGDKVLSGSYVVNGKCSVRLDRVGSQSFVSGLITNAKKMRDTKPRGMMRSLTKLVQVIGITLIPLSVGMYIKEVWYLGASPKEAVVATAGSVLGMIPEGLYLLTSVALAVSVVRLAQKKTLAHDLGCIETLARVDVLCVDKTGTITEDTMRMTGIVPVCADNEKSPLYTETQAARILGDLVSNLEADNATMIALKENFKSAAFRNASEVVGFTSAYKYSGAAFGDGEVYVLGAPEFILRDGYEAYRGQVDSCANEGNRVLMIAKYHGRLDGGALCYPVTPIALVLLVNNIRKEAPDTFKYFVSQNVTVKVISGDNPITAAKAAQSAGIPDSERYLDCSTVQSAEKLATLANDYTVFGRVTPEQKRTLIRALKKAGHTVAMTGDGVNDVLALKEADCAIAMASGSEIASQVAHLVLLDSNFASMPAVVAEGRRVINNIERSASLYIVKNIFSFLLTIISIFAMFSYPISPAQLSLVSAFTIGIPSFFLALQPNSSIVRGNFMKNVIRRAFPSALTNLFVIIGTVLFRETFGLDVSEMSTVCALLIGVVGFIMLWYVCSPFNLRRLVIFCGCVVLCTISIFIIPEFFALVPLSFGSILIFVVFAMLAMFMTGTFRKILNFIGIGARNIFKKIKNIRLDELFHDDGPNDKRSV